MRTIICKKCGVEIDPSLGVCPNCGAVYYILPEEDISPEGPVYPTQEQWTAPPPEQQFFIHQTPGETIHSREDISYANNDELFNTRVWQQTDDVDETRAFRAASPRQSPPPSPPRQRQAQAPRPPKKDPNLRKKQLLVGIVSLLAVLTLIVSFMSGAFDFNKNNEKIFMSSVEDLDETVARAELEKLGLSVQTSVYEYNEKAQGTVLKQSIKAGQVVAKKDKITLTVSRGPDTTQPDVTEVVEVPTLTGVTYEHASQTALAAGLRVTKAEDVFSSTVPEGKVISQSPVAGTEVNKGDNVVLVVSKGEEPEPVFEITVMASTGGKISPSGLVEVKENTDQTFVITPDPDYELRELKVDGVDVGVQNSYTFTKVTGPHSIYAVFQRIPTTPPPTESIAPPSVPPVVNSPVVIS